MTISNQIAATAQGRSVQGERPMLFSKKDEKTTEPKRRSWFGLMFAPDFGRDVKPVGEALSVFVYLIASIFVSAQLFPADHPALREQGTRRLTLFEVLVTAWNKLVLKRENLFQIVLFFSVVACLLMSILGVVIFLFSLLSVPAHAASSNNMFTPSDASSDWGLSWLNYAFLGKSISFMGAADTSGLTTDCGWRQALGKALSYYSGGILVVAGVMLLYHLTFMIVETAYHGTPMGKQANQIWAPIRLVVAIGLLVPVASSSSSSEGCSMNGLNTGQYIAIQMAKWGSGLASNIWTTFREQLAKNSSESGSCISRQKAADGTVDYSKDTAIGSPSCVQVSPTVREFAFGMISNLACKAIYNYNIEQYGPSVYYQKLSLDSKTHLIGSSTVWGDSAICGGYEPINTNNLKSGYKSVYEAQNAVVASFINDAEKLVDKYYKYLIDHSKEADTQDTAKVSDDFYVLVTKFQTDLEKAAYDQLPHVDVEINSQTNSSTNIIGKGGWVAAGAWFNDIALQQSQRSDSVNGAVPKLIPQTLPKRAAETVERSWFGQNQAAVDLNGVEKRVVKDLANFNSWLEGGLSEAKKAELAAINSQPLGSGGDRKVADLVFGAIDTVGSAVGLWNGKGILAVKFDKTRNPFAEVVAFGQNSVAMGTYLMGIGAALLTGGKIIDVIQSFSKKFTFGLTDKLLGVAAGIMSFIGGILITLGTIYLGFGIALGFWLPLSPFIRFFFGSLTWLLAVFEAVVAMPLLALAHLNPGGNGLPGPDAKRGYYFILNIFLRPSLMIFGLIAGYIMFTIAISFLNTMFIFAAKGASDAGGGNLPALARCVYSLVYCALVYGLAQNCFKAIGLFPQQAMSWLGGSAQQMEAVGNHGLVNKMAAYMGGQFVQGQLTNLAKTPVGALDRYKDKRTIAKNLKDNNDAAAAQAERDKTQNAIAAHMENLASTKGRPDIETEMGGESTKKLSDARNSVAQTLGSVTGDSDDESSNDKPKDEQGPNNKNQKAATDAPQDKQGPKKGTGETGGTVV